MVETPQRLITAKRKPQIPEVQHVSDMKVGTADSTEKKSKLLQRILKIYLLSKTSTQIGDLKKKHTKRYETTELATEELIVA